MLRQVGLAVGVAVLIAVLGSSTVRADRLSAFQHGWIVIALTSLASSVAGGVLLARRRRSSSAIAPVGAAPAIVNVDAE
jgi:hypothetical protein